MVLKIKDIAKTILTGLLRAVVRGATLMMYIMFNIWFASYALYAIRTSTYELQTTLIFILEDYIADNILFFIFAIVFGTSRAIVIKR